MGFSQKQTAALQRALNEAHIRTRQAHGRDLSYIEGWHAISEANRIFGFEGWDRETTESKCLSARESRGAFHAIYIAKVRISVRADSQTVVREGHGTAEGRGDTLADAHDMGLKAAETDATKRALATFGKPFGLSLYLSKTARANSAHNAADTIPSSSQPTVKNSDRRASNGMRGSIRMVPPGRPASFRIAPLAPVPSDAALIDTRIDKSALTLGYPPRRRDKEHLRFVAAQPCLLCSRAPSDAHHVRFAQHRAMGRKVSDEFTVPLCRTHHRQLHQSGNELAWWMDMDIDPLEIAKGLWEERQIQRKTAPVHEEQVVRAGPSS